MKYFIFQQKHSFLFVFTKAGTTLLTGNPPNVSSFPMTNSWHISITACSCWLSSVACRPCKSCWALEPIYPEKKKKKIRKEDIREFKCSVQLLCYIPARVEDERQFAFLCICSFTSFPCHKKGEGKRNEISLLAGLPVQTGHSSGSSPHCSP